MVTDYVLDYCDIDPKKDYVEQYYGINPKKDYVYQWMRKQQKIKKYAIHTISSNILVENSDLEDSN